MGAAAEKPKLTYAEYLALERETGARYEFVDGVVYATAGGSFAHARVTAVLSPDTERNDRGSKFTAYQSIPSLRHYLLVSQDEHRVEHYERVREGQWTLSIYGPGGVVTLADLGGAIDVDALYAGEDQERPNSAV